MSLAVRIQAYAVATGAVLGLASPATAVVPRHDVFVPCTADRDRALNDAITAANDRPGTRWEISLRKGCAYTLTAPFGGVRAGRGHR